jgi:hypothetical protein
LTDLIQITIVLFFHLNLVKYSPFWFLYSYSSMLFLTKMFSLLILNASVTLLHL